MLHAAGLRQPIRPVTQVRVTLLRLAAATLTATGSGTAVAQARLHASATDSPTLLPRPGWDGRQTIEVSCCCFCYPVHTGVCTQGGHLQVLVLVLLGQYLVDRWLLDLCLDIVAPTTTAQELAVELFCQTGASSCTCSLHLSCHHFGWTCSLHLSRGERCAVKLPLLAAIVWGKLRKWHPLRSGFFSFRTAQGWGLRLALLCLLVPLGELPLYHLRVRWSASGVVWWVRRLLSDRICAGPSDACR